MSEKFSVIVTKKPGLQIALNVDVGGSPVEILFTYQKHDGLDPIEDRERGLGVDEGVALAVQILRAFDPSKLAEYTPLDLDAIFSSPSAQEEMRKVNEIMQDLPYDEGLETDTDVDGAPDTMRKGDVNIIAVQWDSSQAQLSNGVVVPITNFIDLHGEEVDSHTKAIVFVAGSDEQGWCTDYVASYVDLEETLGELTSTIAAALLGDIDFGDPLSEGFTRAYGLLAKYDSKLAEVVRRSILGETRPEDLDIAFEEHDYEADKDVSGITVRPVTYNAIMGARPSHNFVQDAARGPVRNEPASKSATLGCHRAPLRRSIGGDVAGPQSDKTITLDEKAHGHE